MTFNQALWQLVESAGWLFWLPLTVYGAYGASMVYRMPPAEEMLGRVARVVQMMGFICMIFIPFFNGLGPYAFHLLGIAACLILWQYRQACIRSGKIKPPEAETVVGRLAERVAVVKT